MDTYYQRFLHLENRIHHQLVAHSIAALRIAVGLIFLGFGILKFFPGVSPAESITRATTHILFLGPVPGDRGRRGAPVCGPQTLIVITSPSRTA